MNKKMRELSTLIQNKLAEVKNLMDGENKDVEKANAIMDEIDGLQKEYDAEERAYNLEKSTNAQTITPVEPSVEKKVEVDAVSKFGADAKLGFKKTMTESVVADGGYAVPEDVVTRIEEHRASKASLLDYVDVVKVTTNKGSRTFKTRANQTGFTKVGEGAKIGAKATPQFELVEYEIEKYAGYFPVTNELLADADASLGQTLINWIGDESRVTANKLILAGIATNTATDLKNLDGIKKALNVTLGSAFKATSKIFTNDDGLQYLDTLKDANGRYMLSANPSNPAEMVLCAGANSIPVVVIPNADMPTSTTKVPFVIGDLSEGIKYFDRAQMSIMISNTAVVGTLNAYESDLTLYRAIEREDVVVADKGAFVNGYITVA